MRILCGILAGVLLLFAIVQYNDSDALFWGGVYGIGVFWCGLAAFSPSIFDHWPARLVLLATLAAAGGAVIAFWPEADHWWTIEVWWPEISGKNAREGMGVMILFTAMLAATAVALRRT